MQKNKIIIIVGIIALVVGFLGGMSYGKSHPSVALDQNASRGGSGANGSGGFGGRRGGMQSGGFVTGSVLTKDATGITVQARYGSSKIIFVGSSTMVAKSTTGLFDDVTIGAQVTVMGSANPDGSVNAQSIQIRSSEKK